MGVYGAFIKATVPGAPKGVSATAGTGQATISFSAPVSDGGSAITGHTVTSSGGQTGSGAASPITVGGLTNGKAYTFRVAAKNQVGTGLMSAPSNKVTPDWGSVTITITPAAAAKAGVTWCVDSSNQWQKSGATVNNLVSRLSYDKFQCRFRLGRFRKSDRQSRKWEEQVSFWHGHLPVAIPLGRPRQAVSMSVGVASPARPPAIVHRAA